MAVLGGARARAQLALLGGAARRRERRRRPRRAELAQPRDQARPDRPYRRVRNEERLGTRRGSPAEGHEGAGLRRESLRPVLRQGSRLPGGDDDLRPRTLTICFPLVLELVTKQSGV